jgi:shikimate kinase
MPSSRPSAEHVVLVGMMGAGKTTVGRILSERLGRPFLDSDQVIEARTGRTVAQIFEADGEPAFRVLESAALAEALSDATLSVIAAAGGVVLDPDNRRRMRERAWVVWLRADPTVLAGRVGSSDHRPLLEDDPDAALRRLYGERLPLYAEVAEEVVDVDTVSPEEAAEKILAAMPR